MGGGGNWTQNGHLSISVAEGTGTGTNGHSPIPPSFGDVESGWLTVGAMSGIYLVGQGLWEQKSSVEINVTSPSGGQGKAPQGPRLQAHTLTFSNSLDFTGIFFSSEATWLVRGDVNISCTLGSECMCEVPAAQRGWDWAVIGRQSLGDQTLAAQCFRCPTGQYSLDSAECSRMVPAVKCHDCPSGADCSRGGFSVYALASYWCGQREEDASSLECTACPSGYCVDNVVGPWDHACIASRQGVLCLSLIHI